MHLPWLQQPATQVVPSHEPVVPVADTMVGSVSLVNPNQALPPLGARTASDQPGVTVIVVP